MENKNVIRRFRVLKSSNDYNDNIQKAIQHVLYYAESRFWFILKFLTNAGQNKQSWCQILLQRELVSDNH